MTGGPAAQTPEELSDALRELVMTGALDLTQPGAGNTGERLRRLAGIAARDLALARLAEAHLDAVTILREAGREPERGATYGVWASEAPHAVLTLTDGDGDGDGPLVLDGRKAFCTGAGMVDRALVTAAAGPSVVLVDIEASGVDFVTDPSDWITPAFAATRTATVEIAARRLDPSDLVGGPGWYLDRIGFWHGALAPAACWAGGAIGLAEYCTDLARCRTVDDHVAAHLGRLDAMSWELGAVLRAAGHAVDAQPGDPGFAVRHAHRVRSAVERLVTDMIDEATRAHGPRLLAFDPWAARRIAELQLYVRQHHGARDHAALARLVL